MWLPAGSTPPDHLPQEQGEGEVGLQGSLVLGAQKQERGSTGQIRNRMQCPLVQQVGVAAPFNPEIRGALSTPMLYPETGIRGAVTLGTVQTVMWVPSPVPMVSGTGGLPGTAVKGEPDSWHLAFSPLGSFSLCGHPTFPTSYFQRTSSSRTPHHHPSLVPPVCLFCRDLPLVARRGW